MMTWFADPGVRALLLAVAAGFSTLLGALVIFFVKKSEKLITVSLGFAAGVMVSVSFVELYPSAMEQLGRAAGERMGVLLTVLFLALGVLLAALMDRFVPHQAFDKKSGGNPHQDLFRIGLVSMMALGLHNFPEGIATFMGGFADLSLGVSIAIAIAMHNIPEGVAVAMPIYYATGSRKRALLYTLMSGMAEPLGALLAFLLLRPFINDFLMGAMFALVAGIMLYLSVEELIPSSRQYGHTRLALLSTFVGLLLMPLAEMI